MTCQIQKINKSWQTQCGYLLSDKKRQATIDCPYCRGKLKEKKDGT